MREKIRANYHYVIACVTILAVFVVGGVANAVNGVTLIPITESLGVTRGEYSRTMITVSVSGVILNLFSGMLLMKFGYRKLISAMLIVSAVGYMMASGAQTLPFLCVVSILKGLYSLCVGAGNPRLLGSWFHRHYGLMIGIVSAMTGLGGSVFSILLSKIVIATSWRGAFVTIAGCYFIVALLIALVIRDTPGSMALRPYGEGYIPKNNKKVSDDHWEGFSFTTLKKKPTFYLMLLGTFLSCSCCYMAFSVVNSHVQDCGMSTEFGAKVQSLLLFALAATKLGFGYLSDKVGARLMALVSLTALVVSMFLLAGITGPASAYIAALIYSLALPLCLLMPALLVPTLFGYRSGAKAMGTMMAMVSAASLVAAPLSNTLRDILGSYRPVFRGTALVSLGVLAIYLMTFAFVAIDRKKLEQQKVS